MTGRRVLLGIALFAIALGIFARLDSLDRKVLWFDESYSLLRISGHNEAALNALFDGKVHPSDRLLALQQVSPKLGLRETLASLREEPQRGPLYYLLARLWIGLAGNGTAAVRGLSVLLGIGGIGLAFLLGRRLTGGIDGGCVLAAMTALSPIEIRFSQQVREYVLVADLTLLSVLLLLRALDVPQRWRWCALGACLLAGLYTNATFAFLIFGEGLIALWYATRARSPAPALGFFAAVAGAGALYAPWAYEAARSAASHSINIAWAAGPYPLRASLLKWVFNAGAVFFDSEYAHVRLGVVLLPLLALMALAFARAFAGRQDPRLRVVVALAVTFSTAIPIVILDVLRHAHYELVARYQMPTWLGLLMVVTLLIVSGLRAPSSLARAGAGGALGFVLCAGAASVFVDRPYSEWWDNNDHLSESAVADVVRAGARPALVVASNDDDMGFDSFVLSRYLAPGTPMLLIGERLPALPRGYAVTYFFTPTRDELTRATASAGAPPHNVSPAIGLRVPELNAVRNATVEAVVADNALWASVPSAARRASRL